MDAATAMLLRQGLIQERTPHYFVSVKIAAATDTGASYTRSKGLEKQKLEEFILQHLREFGPTSRVKLEELLFEMLPAGLTVSKGGYHAVFMIRVRMPLILNKKERKE